MPDAGVAYEGRRRVLVVDEEPIVLDFITTLLTRAGYGAVATRTSAEALSPFLWPGPELALMVFDIATVGGREFIDDLPILNPRIPVILMSGLGEYEEPKALTPIFQSSASPSIPAICTSGSEPWRSPLGQFKHGKTRRPDAYAMARMAETAIAPLAGASAAVAIEKPRRLANA